MTSTAHFWQQLLPAAKAALARANIFYKNNPEGSGATEQKGKTNSQQGKKPHTHTRLTKVSRTVSVSVTIREKQEALAYALQLCEKRQSPKKLVFWTDGSARHSPALEGAYAAVYKENRSWTLITGAMPSITSMMAELKGVLLALEVAMQTINESTTPRGNISVTIMSDCQRLLEHIQGTTSHGHPLKPKQDMFRGVWDILTMCERLGQLGAHICFHWVPGGAVEGNKVAHKAAHDALLRHTSAIADTAPTTGNGVSLKL